MMDFETGREIEADMGAVDNANAELLQGQGRAAQDGAGRAERGPERVLAPNDQNVVILPPGASLEDLQVEGRDLVIVLADGTRIVIPDGAIIVPQLVVNGVAVPPANLAALLTGNEPQPAAGPPESSGGNFTVDPGDIQAAYGLGDLLPYTELNFPEAPEREIIPDIADRDPEVVVVTPDNPAGAVAATASVSEAGLPARNGGEPQGTAASTNVEVTTGAIVFTSPDGFASLTINGVAITQVGQTIQGSFGTLTITSISPGSIGYSYTLIDNLLGDGVDRFSIAVTDLDGDIATATLDVRIIDDTSISVDDSDTIPAGTFGPATGNVLTGEGTIAGVAGADTVGADDAMVTGIAHGAMVLDVTVGTIIAGTYGFLVINPDGSYVYTRFPGTPGGVSDEFPYTVTDSDGSATTSVLTIDIGDSPATVISVPETGAGTVVDEDGLPPRDDEAPGTATGTDSETTAGTITFSAPDGPATLTINGVTITGPGQTIVTPEGTLTIVTFDPVAGTLGYSFTLADNTGGDDTSVTFTVTVTDQDGDSDTEDFTITIIDDTPLALDDAAAQTSENASVTVDVFANDTEGADSVAFGAIAAVPGTLSGAGSLAYNGDGTFTYTPAPGEEGTVTFDYTITDGDGDSSTATVTITLLADSTPGIAVSGDTSVDEAALGARPGEPAGSNAASDGEVASGAIAVTTGNDTIASLFINGIDVTGGGTVTTASGVLTVTFTGGAYGYSYELTDNTLADPDSDVFTLTVTDSDGDPASTTLTIDIVDDAPSAADDANAISAGTYGPATGNVLANDTQGADSASVTGYSGAGGTGAAGSVIQGTYGTLTIAADGSYSYARDPGTPGGVSDSFTYTITDADGDAAQAQLVIAIADSPTTLDVPVAGEAGTQVLEEGLAGPPAGSNAAGDGEFTSGTFTFTAPDGPASVTIGGVTVDSVGDSVVGDFGTLTVTAIGAGSVSYTYELTTNTSGDDTSDSFAVVVTDQDGDFSSSDLVVDILDDVPTARADTDAVAEDGPLTAGGNVITDAEADGGADTSGADGASVTAVAFGANAGTVGTSLTGAYGALTLNADGSYSYVLDNGNAFVQGLDSTESLTEVFSYTLTDGDGDASPTTLTITIQGTDDGVIVNGLDGAGAEEVLAEDDLANGSSPNAAALTQTGSFSVDSPDGLTTLTVGGVTVFDAASATVYPVTIDDPVYGLLQITGVAATTDGDGDVVSATISYSYVLDDNSLLHSGGNDGSFTDSFAVVATDSDGSSDTSSLDITVLDDVPTARADTDAVAEDGPLTAGGNVITDAEADGGADTSGADGASVTAVAFGATAGTVGTSLTGAYGALTLNADGSYSYVLDNGNAFVQGLDSTESLTEVFSYTLTDGDGDASPTTLTITIQGTDDGVTVNGLDGAGAEEVLAEDDLANGSSPNAAALTQTGSFSVDSPDGLTTLTVGGVTVFNAASATVYPVTIDDPVYGLLQITGVAATTDGDGDVVSATISYSYVLDDNSLLHSGGNDGSFTDSFAVVATDSDGSSDTSSLDITVLDDVPTARADTDAVAEDGPLTAGGNVITDAEADGGADTSGADGASVTAVAFGATAGTVGTSLTGAYGALTLNADGSYSYVLDNGNAFVQGLDSTESLTEVFSYTLTDGDGDASPTTLTITIQGTDDGVIVNGLDGAGAEEVLAEDDLANGSSPNAAALTQTGSFSVDSPDGLTTLTVGGVTVFDAASATVYPVTIDDPVYGLLQITGVAATTDGDGDVVSATISYSYVLDDNSLLHSGGNDGAFTDSFAVVATDSDGSSDTSSLDITVLDDVPTANDDNAGQVTENQAFTIDALDNDVFGADGVDTADAADVFVSTQASQGVVTYDPATGLFTYTPNAGAGSNGDTSDSFEYTIVDADGDVSTATVSVTLQPDSEPEGGLVTATVDDDGLAGANPNSTMGDLDANLGDDPADTSEASFTGTLAFDVLNDTPPAISFDPALNGATAQVGLEMVTYSVTGNVLTATGTRGVLFTVEITDTATGAYTVTLRDNVLHEGGPNDEAIDALASIDFVVSDSEGETVSTSLDIVFDDDAPTAFNNSNSVTEGGEIGGNVLSDGTGDIAGADGFAAGAVLSIASTNQATSDTSANGSGNFVLEGEFGTLTLNQNGTYSYASDPNATNVDDADVFTYTVVDADGDTSTATLTINVQNVAGNVFDDDATVDEAGLPIGSDPTASSETDADGQITVTGAVGPFTYVLTSPADGSFGTITLDANTGAYTYVLDTPFTDTDTLENTTNVVNGAEGFTYEVYDSANNLIGSGTISVNIVDDIPTATDQTLISVTEDALAAIGGNVMTDGVADTEGADLATVTAITIGAITTTVPQDGNAAVVVTANGTYTIDMDGAWTFDPVPGLDQTGGPIDASFTYTLTDGDDDFDTGIQPIQINDGAAPADPAGISLSVDDQNLADGSTPAGPDSDSDTISFVPGSDPFASIVFGDTAGLGGNLTWVRVDDFTITGSDGGRLVVTLTLDVTGDDAAVTATLDDNYLGHGSLGDELDDLGSVSVVATDIDGNVATGNVDVAVSDDVPSVSANLTVLLDDDALGGNSGGTDDDADSANTSGTLGFDFNADGAGSISFLTTGEPAGFTYAASGNDILVQQNQGGVMVTVLTVTLNATTGAYTVTQNNNILHDNADDENNESFTLTYVVTDGDGDTAQGTLTIDVDDDTPVITNVALDSSLDLDETDAVSPGGFPISDTSADPIIEVTGNFGADGQATSGATAYAITIVGGGITALQTADGDFPITLVQTNATTITGTYEDGGTQPAFTLVINSDGTVTLTQEVPLEHLIDGAAHNDTLTLAGLVSASVTLTDADGDTVTQSAPIGGAVTFFDDGPLAQDDTNSLSEDTVSVGGNILTDGTNDDFGADGAGSPQITAIIGTAAGTVGGNTTGSWGTLALASDGAYTYTLNTAAVQDIDDGETRTDTFTYTIIDADGDTDTATLTVTINGGNDAPVAADDTNWVLDVTAGADPTTMGNVLQDVNHPGAPSGSFADVEDTDVDVETLTVTGLTGGAVGVSLAGTYGAIVVNGDGTYTYTLDSDNAAVDALDDGETLTDSFTYTVSDGDATDTAMVTITIFGTNDAPVLTPSVTAVSEEGLIIPAGNPDDDPITPADADTTDSRTANGSIGIADPDGDTFTVTLGSPSATLTSGGETIVWTVSNGGLLLTGATTAGTVATVSIDATGAYSVSLERQIDHADTTTEDTTSFVIPVSVSDGTAPAAMTNITVTVEDDSPILGVFSPDSTTVDNVANATAVGTFAYSPGGDGHGDFTITYTGDPIPGVTYSTTQIDSDMDGVNDGAILTATAGTDTLYTLEVDTDGEYTFTLVTPDAETQQDLSFSNLSAGGPGFRELEDDPATTGVNETGRVEFFTDSVIDPQVNANNNNFGVGDTHLDIDEHFIMEFHNPGILGNDAASTDPEFLSSIEIDINTLKNSPGNIGPNVTLSWTATNTATGETESGTVLVTATGNILIDPSIEFNQMRIENVNTSSTTDGGRVQIGGITVFKTILPQDLALDFDISATDSDGDPSATSTLSVLVDASTVAPLSANAMSMFSLDTALAHDAGSNDNGGEGGPALFGARLGTGSAAMRADMRAAELTTVAAAATGFMLAQSDPAMDQMPFAAEMTTFASLDTAAAGAGAMAAEATSPVRGFEFDGRLESIEGGRTTMDLPSALGREPVADFANGLSGPMTSEIARGEPLFDFGGGFDGLAQNASMVGLSNAMDAGAAMEALLLIEANAPATHADAQRTLAGIEDALGDIASEQVVEQLAAFFGAGHQEGLPGEVAPLLEGGPLGQLLHGGGSAFDLASATADQIEEAALAVAAMAQA